MRANKTTDFKPAIEGFRKFYSISFTQILEDFLQDKLPDESTLLMRLQYLTPTEKAEFARWFDIHFQATADRKKEHSPRELLLLGIIYRDGITGNQNFDLALSFFTAAADESALSYYCRGELFYLKSEHPLYPQEKLALKQEAEDCFATAAEKGSAWAHVRLARDFNKLKHTHYLLAAASKDPSGIYYFRKSLTMLPVTAELLIEPKIEVNYVEAAKGGEPKALIELGKFYEEKNRHNDAALCFRYAAEKGELAAIKELTFLFYENPGNKFICYHAALGLAQLIVNLQASGMVLSALRLEPEHLTKIQQSFDALLKRTPDLQRLMAPGDSLEAIRSLVLDQKLKQRLDEEVAAKKAVLVLEKELRLLSVPITSTLKPRRNLFTKSSKDQHEQVNLLKDQQEVSKKKLNLVQSAKEGKISFVAAKQEIDKIKCTSVVVGRTRSRSVT